jgi:hypothetical protein
MKAILTRPIKFTKGNLHYTARKGTPVIVIETKEQTVRILFKWFMRWVSQKSVKVR